MFLFSNFFTKLSNYAVDSVLPIIVRIVIAIVVFFVCRLLIRLIMRLVKKLFKKIKWDEGVENFLASIIKFLLYAALIAGIVEILGVGTATIVSVIGSAGLAIGLALQGSLSNFAGGVLILILKPFHMGDYIVACGQEGTVVSIDIFYTKIRTPDYKDIVIPNGQLSNSSIVNVSAQNKRRHDIVVGVSYDSDIEKVKETLLSVVKASALVKQDEEMTCFISEYADSAIVFNLRFWVTADNYWSAKFEVTESIKKEFDKAGIEIPYKQIDVTVVSDK